MRGKIIHRPSKKGRLPITPYLNNKLHKCIDSASPAKQLRKNWTNQKRLQKDTRKNPRKTNPQQHRKHNKKYDNFANIDGLKKDGVSQVIQLG